MTNEIRDTLKENEVILILHIHITNEISETFKENEVMLLLHILQCIMFFTLYLIYISYSI